MGQVYVGPFAEEIGYDKHEGFANRKMPDGRWSNGVWSAEFPDTHVAFAAECTCGWRSEIMRPPTEQGEEAADNDWDLEHLQPMIRAVASKYTIPAVDVLDWMADVRKTYRKITRGERAGELTERSGGIADALDSLGQFLDDQARRQSER